MKCVKVHVLILPARALSQDMARGGVWSARYRRLREGREARSRRGEARRGCGWVDRIIGCVDWHTKHDGILDVWYKYKSGQVCTGR